MTEQERMGEEQVTISFYGPKRLRNGLDRLAKEEGRSRSNLLIRMLEPVVQRRLAELKAADNSQVKKGA